MPETFKIKEQTQIKNFSLCEARASNDEIRKKELRREIRELDAILKESASPADDFVSHLGNIADSIDALGGASSAMNLSVPDQATVASLKTMLPTLKDLHERFGGEPSGDDSGDDDDVDSEGDAMMVSESARHGQRVKVDLSQVNFGDELHMPMYNAALAIEESLRESLRTHPINLRFVVFEEGE